ncbi:hypothetical protein [Pseudonocardia humida]|uniref:Deazaflavin-dependent oxidoreductase (Nitroreductase family) n=1 Tax=Pseudonocardia humida TaxID=2800819 RepID=A0ABT1A2M5_9PSEU|nr:hypothetical protein [Pseudonocardia humida]MCO1657266.1 hypothetical protein [Pseudonocardia humida]
MTQQSPGTAPHARPMRFQGVANRIVRALLATPLVSRGIGQRLVTVHVVGRKSGRRFAVPVAFTRHEGALLIGTSFAWGRNLRTGEPVEVRYLGRLRRADVRVHTEEADVVRLYDVIARDNHQFAKFNGLGLDAAGNPDPDDLRAAWAAGARVLELRVRD